MHFNVQTSSRGPRGVQRLVFSGTEPDQPPAPPCPGWSEGPLGPGPPPWPSACPSPCPASAGPRLFGVTKNLSEAEPHDDCLWSLMSTTTITLNSTLRIALVLCYQYKTSSSKRTNNTDHLNHESGRTNQNVVLLPRYDAPSAAFYSLRALPAACTSSSPSSGSDKQKYIHPTLKEKKSSLLFNLKKKLCGLLMIFGKVTLC